MDRLNMHKDEGKQKIAMTMAGKAAEIIKYGDEGVSSGPADPSHPPRNADFERLSPQTARPHSFAIFPDANPWQNPTGA
jgi:hypothetical protein